ncbi:MAG: hypothetical protein ACLVAT_02825 [Lachnospiraceae bacterium]
MDITKGCNSRCDRIYSLSGADTDRNRMLTRSHGRDWIRQSELIRKQSNSPFIFVGGGAVSFRCGRRTAENLSHKIQCSGDGFSDGKRRILPDRRTVIQVCLVCTEPRHPIWVSQNVIF